MNARRCTPQALGTMLSIWAHPDDETHLAGGVMAAARDAGQRVVCAAATAGEHGTDRPDLWPPARLGLVRRWEAAAAMAVLGVTEHHLLGLPDGRLSENTDHGLRWVGQLIDDVRPDTIVTFGPDGMTYHPAHLAVHAWVTAAWCDRSRPCRLLYAASTTDHLARFGELFESWNVYMSDQRPDGVAAEHTALQLRLTGSALDRKLPALRAMAARGERSSRRSDTPDCRSGPSADRSVAQLVGPRLYAIFTSSPVCKAPAEVTAAYTPAHGDIVPPASRRL